MRSPSASLLRHSRGSRVLRRAERVSPVLRLLDKATTRPRVDSALCAAVRRGCALITPPRLTTQDPTLTCVDAASGAHSSDSPRPCHRSSPSPLLSFLRVRLSGCGLSCFFKPGCGCVPAGKGQGMGLLSGGFSFPVSSALARSLFLSGADAPVRSALCFFLLPSHSPSLPPNAQTPPPARAPHATATGSHEPAHGPRAAQITARIIVLFHACMGHPRWWLHSPSTSRTSSQWASTGGSGAERYDGYRCPPESALSLFCALECPRPDSLCPAMLPCAGCTPQPRRPW